MKSITSNTKKMTMYQKKLIVIPGLAGGKSSPQAYGASLSFDFLGFGAILPLYKYTSRSTMIGAINITSILTISIKTIIHLHHY